MPNEHDGQRTVLLAEDEKCLRELTALVLERYGFAVLSACDARMAIELAKEHEGPIDLLLTDLFMPGTKGDRLAKEFGQMYPEAKILYMTGHAAEDVVGRIDVPLEEIITKPYRIEMLADKVEEALRAREKYCKV